MQKKETIRVIVKEPGREPQRWLISNELRRMQKIVGGHIEVIRFAEDAAMIVNEEGKLLGLEPNFRYGSDMIIGTVILVGVDGEEFTDWPVDMDAEERVTGGGDDA